MTGPDLLDDLGTPNCPGCLEPMEPAGTAREVAVADVSLIVGSAYWACRACGLIATI